MLYFVIAHSAEAQPIIQFYKLKRVYKFSYTMFESDSVKLIISNIGIENGMMATSVLLGYCIPTQNDLLINIGICASHYDIGTTLLIHKITHNNNSYFPDILFDHNLQENSLKTVDEPATEISSEAVDMESYGIYKAASRFLKAHQMIFLKIVSDNFQPESVTKNETKALISSSLDNLQDIISKALSIFDQDDIFSPKEIKFLNLVTKKLTKSQSNALLDACKYYKLHYKKQLPESKIQQINTITTKQQRSVYLNDLIKTLAQ